MVCQGGDLYGKAVGAKRWNEVFGNMQEAARFVTFRLHLDRWRESIERRLTLYLLCGSTARFSPRPSPPT
jgi:hypothetical protein